MNPSESIELACENPKAAALLIHGFTASPSEMLELGKFLNQHGYHVLIPCLPGHGTTPEDLDQRQYHEWIAEAESAYLKLQGRFEKVFVLGLSMGATISFFLAARHANISGLVFFAAPYWIRSKSLHAWMKFCNTSHLWKIFEWQFGKCGIAKPPSKYPLSKRFSYAVYPVKALRELLRIVEKSKMLFGKIRQPALFLHSNTDQVAIFPSLAAITSRLPSPPQIEILDNYSHVITCDPRRQVAFEKTLEFLERNKKS